MPKSDHAFIFKLISNQFQELAKLNEGEGGLRECEHLIHLTISRESGDPLKKDTSTFFITHIESVYLILVYVKILYNTTIYMIIYTIR